MDENILETVAEDVNDVDEIVEATDNTVKDVDKAVEDFDESEQTGGTGPGTGLIFVLGGLAGAGLVEGIRFAWRKGKQLRSDLKEVKRMREQNEQIAEAEAKLNEATETPDIPADAKEEEPKKGYNVLKKNTKK